MPTLRAAPSRPLRLAAIGTLAGVFSGLFGVGGGTVIVPLLIFWLGYGERLATGTSLGAIVVIGAARRARAGRDLRQRPPRHRPPALDPGDVRVVIGTAIQQRISQRAVSLLFAALLVAVAIELIVPDE